MSCRGGEDRAGSRAIDERLNVGVAAAGRDGEAGNAVGIGGRTVVDAADSAGGRGGEDKLTVLHHESGGEFHLLDEGDGRRTAIESELPPVSETAPLGSVTLHSAGDNWASE